MKQFTLAEFINEFGDVKQRESLVKGKGNVNKRTLDSVIKKASKFYELDSITVKGRGVDKIITCGKERHEVLNDKEIYNYSNCGNREQMPYKEIIQNLILIHLNEKNRKPSTTYRVLAHDLEIMSDVLFSSSNMVTAEEQKNYYKNLDAKYKKQGFAVFWDNVSKESQRIIRNVESVLNDMKEKGIIRHMDVVNAVSLDKFGREIHNPITYIEVNKIDMMKRKLRGKHEVTITDIRYKPKSPAVVAYKEDEYNFLQSFGYEYVYDAVYIDLIATDKEIQNYMKDSLVTDFKKEHLAFAYQKAVARENSFFNDIVRVKDNHKLHKLLGGKKKSDVLKGTLTAYDSILIDELLNDGIKQEKFGKTYATNYKESLKTIQDVLDEEESKSNL
ncbi:MULTISPECIES: hypothetical protein [Bacillaceae]|uniref:hypothetical protein n=1 Tax=Bacillaceae TaxID=186817 RepID=UPI000BFEA9E8|nr:MULTISPECIES: hypothetical protein [Bacillaceae]PGT78169.1 hypothetical protein COD11_23695 [Bacillus sp. AFS040349]UTI44168.1 hypothetical protein NKG37_11410 [Niallia sp. RD1]